MSDLETWQTTTNTAQQTQQLAQALGAKLVGGEIIELMSDLGGGKTTFVRGLAQGMGSSDRVSSPTFTIKNEYHAKNLTLHHFDFYRLGSAGIMRDELAEILADPLAVTVIEWATIVEDVLPKEHLTITITASAIETGRNFLFNYPETYAAIIPRNS